MADASAKFMFLLPNDYKKMVRASAAVADAPVGGASAAGVVGGGAAAVAGGMPSDAQARKVAREIAIAQVLNLQDSTDVDCVAVDLFLFSRVTQRRCYIVKINGNAKQQDAPLPPPPANKVTIGGRIYNLYASTQLCALQILLNRAACFLPDGRVATDKIGSAFVQFVDPHLFNYLECHKKTLFSVSTYILRNLFAHMRDQTFRTATREGGILDATKLWLKHDLCAPAELAPGDDDDDIQMWRSFDIAEYVFHGSHFAYVFPLCYRSIREILRRDKETLPPRRREAILKCMPAASPDFEISSSLDWYFDHEGKACSLRELMAIRGDGDLQTRVAEGSRTRGTKPGRYTFATTDLFYQTFLHLLKRFFYTTLFLKRQKLAWQAKNPGCSGKEVFFCRDDQVSIDSTADASSEPRVWLGLGQEETIIETGEMFCKPVAIKSRQNINPVVFSRMMRQMKPGSFIASAQEMQLRVHGLGGVDVDPSPRTRRDLDQRHESFLDSCMDKAVDFSYLSVAEGTASSGSSPNENAPGAAAAAAELPNDLYWVSEAGICTLHELFENGVSSEERCTQSHRHLVQEVRFCFCCICSPYPGSIIRRFVS
jgi:hypothetical protein